MDSQKSLVRVFCKNCNGTGSVYIDDFVYDCKACSGLGLVPQPVIETFRKETVRVQWQTKLAIVFRVLQDGSESPELTNEQQTKLRELLDEVIKVERVFLR